MEDGSKILMCNYFSLKRKKNKALIFSAVIQENFLEIKDLNQYTESSCLKKRYRKIPGAPRQKDKVTYQGQRI